MQCFPLIFIEILELHQPSPVYIVVLQGSDNNLRNPSYSSLYGTVYLY